MEWMSLLAIIIFLVILGFLSGLESAFVSSNKLSIELARKQGTFAGSVWSRFASHPTKFMGTVLVGYSLVMVIYGLMIGDWLSPIWNQIEPHLHSSVEPFLKYVRLLVEITLAVAIVLFVEVLSRSVFRALHSKILKSTFIAYVANFFYGILSSAASFFLFISEWILKYLFNKKIVARSDMLTKMDLEQYLNQIRSGESEEVSELNKALFENALSIGEVKLRACLIPRKEIVSIDEKKSIEDARQLFIETKLTRLIVYDGSIDSITGYIHQLDLFSNPRDIRSILHPIPVVPESMTATEMMTRFSKERKSIAWVIDEFGGTAGIVTMEDLLEELFGDIKDEYDLPEGVTERKIREGEYIFGGRIKLDYLQDKYNIKFPETDMETLSGYLIRYNESIPKSGARIIIGHYEIIVMDVSDTRIETVKLKALS